MDQAERDLRIAEELTQSVLKSQPSNRAAILKAAEIARDRMTIAWQRSRHDEALAFARKSAEWLDKFNAGESDKSEAAAILLTYAWVAHQYMLEQKYDEALRLCRRGSDLALLLGRPHDRTGFLDVTALASRYLGNLDEALKSARESVNLQDPGAAELGYPQAMNFVLALAREGWILGEHDGINLGRTNEA